MATLQEHAPNISPDVLRTLHSEMLRIRRVEEKIAELYPEQQMRCPVHLCIGQEAAAVGVTAHLARTDLVFSGHRSHHHYLAKGGDVKAMLAELYGKATGCCGGVGGSMHLIDLSVGFKGVAPILASTVPIAVGTAFSAQLRGEKRVTVTFCGDAAVEEGVFHESLNFASLRQLPVVFVCENNLYATHSPLSVRQPAGREIFELARAHHVPSHQVDGNDAMEVYRFAGEAVERARSGGGPTFLELLTYRWLEHVGPNYDFRLGYRSEEEVRSWQERCPVQHLQKYLVGRRMLDLGELEKLERTIKEEIDEAVAFAKSSPFPDRRNMMQHVYA